MIACGYTLLADAKTERRLFFYFPKKKEFAKINAVGNGWRVACIYELSAILTDTTQTDINE